jgi:hypothetical protein
MIMPGAMAQNLTQMALPGMVSMAAGAAQELTTRQLKGQFSTVPAEMVDFGVPAVVAGVGVFAQGTDMGLEALYHSGMSTLGQQLVRRMMPNGKGNTAARVSAPMARRPSAQQLSQMAWTARYAVPGQQRQVRPAPVRAALPAPPVPNRVNGQRSDSPQASVTGRNANDPSEVILFSRV